MNIFVSRADTVTSVFPKNDCGEDLFIRPSVEKYVLTANIALVSPEFRNAYVPMLVTDDGIVTDVKPIAS